ncbi:unnamed protein product [Agarophyton chilense]
MSVQAPSGFKEALINLVQPLNFGRAVVNDSDKQQEIEDLVRQVEATNPSLTPGTDSNLSGVWDMIYTTSRSILAVDKPGFLQSSRIVQEINAQELKGCNAETFKFGPIEFVNSVNFELTASSPSRFEVNFVQFVILNLLKINVRDNERFTGWLEVTYLDEKLRISRGNKGNLFVLVKK